MLAFAPLAGVLLARAAAGWHGLRLYPGWFAAGAVFAASAASILPAVNGSGPALAAAVGLILGCIMSIAVYAMVDRLWPLGPARMRGGGQKKIALTARNNVRHNASAVLSILLVAFSMGIVHSVGGTPTAMMAPFAAELLWLGFATRRSAARMVTQATEGLLLSLIALLGQMVGMAVSQGATEAYLVAVLAVGFGAAMYVAIHPLLAGLDKAGEPRAAAASFLGGYGGTLLLAAIA